MIAEVVYPKPADRAHWGRNGFFAAGGLSVMRDGDDVVLQGLNSRGVSSPAADLVIPVDQIDAVIQILEKMK